MAEPAKHKRYEIGEWSEATEPAWWARLYVGGNRQAAEMACRAACFPSGLCVTLDETTYIFGGGTEPGVCIGLIQYPPFPEQVGMLRARAITLGMAVAEASSQWSFTIVTPTENIFYSRRNQC